MERFCSSVLRLATLQLIQQAGFDKTSGLSVDVLTDVFGNYLEMLGKTAKNHAMHAGRTKMNAFDVKATFETLGIKVEDLEDWLETERESKNYNKWSGPDPTPVVKDLLATGASKDPADEQLLVFKERFSSLDANKEEFGIFQKKIISKDKLNLGGFNSDFFDESLKGGEAQGKEEEDDGDSVENFDDLFGEAPATPPNGVIPENDIDNTNNEGSKLPSNISEELTSKEAYDRMEDMDIDIIPSGEKPDLSKEANLLKDRPSYIPNYLPPFPEGYPISHTTKEKENNIKTQETGTISDENNINDNNNDEKKSPEKIEKVDADENMQPIKSKNINEDNLTIVNQKSNGSQSRFTSDPLKLLAPENIENVFKSFTPHESPSMSTGAVIESDSQKKKRKFELSFSSVPPGETIFSSSQNGFFEDLEVMVPPGLVPQELQLPMIRITRPPTATNTSRPSEIVSEEMMIDIVGDSNEGESFSSEDASTKPLTISLKTAASSINSEATPLASTGKIKIRLPMKKSATSSTTTSISSASTSTMPPVQFQLPPPLVTPATTQEEIINCICEYPNIDNNKFMIACDTCSTWFHGGCVGFGDEMQVVVDAWHCERCLRKRH
ncbi:12972_t:CDS:2 [Ambispora gerdemannii]|uniref:12972_t:CDS:1 n=1 Tax=Ambispora gerdemannii TaxID=144530 RepID=A0A9N9GXP9_9GLOM|nr:12972_t:CDS:2 [Ambispora gerdemannii]